MDVISQAELDSITNELSSIIDELDNISYELRQNFSNIGTDRCAISIDTVNNNYRSALQKLYNMDTSDIVEGFNKC